MAIVSHDLFEIIAVYIINILNITLTNLDWKSLSQPNTLIHTNTFQAFSILTLHMSNGLLGFNLFQFPTTLPASMTIRETI